MHSLEACQPNIPAAFRSPIGRRSAGAWKNDVPHPVAQLNGHSRFIRWMHRSACGEDCEETLTFHDYLPAKGDDPETPAARRRDWTTVLAIMAPGQRH